MAKGDDVARLPTYSDVDESCSVCGDDNIVIVLNGSAPCQHCGNQINLCSWCFWKMKRDIDNLGV